eukprot:4002420-Pyramimonas_sp.AAC.1
MSDADGLDVEFLLRAGLARAPGQPDQGLGPGRGHVGLRAAAPFPGGPRAGAAALRQLRGGCALQGSGRCPPRGLQAEACLARF